MIEKLPRTIDPVRLAKQRLRLLGMLPLSEMARLQDLCDQMDQTVCIDLQFDFNEISKPIIVGPIAATVNLICQRCNQPMTIQINSMLSLSPVVTEAESQDLPSTLEPWVTGGELVVLSDMIEEEILLNLPMFPKHADEACACKRSC